MRARLVDWVTEGGENIYATLVIRPLGCPLDYDPATTNCAGCDEFIGLKLVRNVKNSGDYTPGVDCAAEKMGKDARSLDIPSFEASLLAAVEAGVKLGTTQKELSEIRAQLVPDENPLNPVPDDVLPAIAALKLYLLEEQKRCPDMGPGWRIEYEMTSHGDVVNWHQFLVVYPDGLEEDYEVEESNGKYTAYQV